MGDFQNAENFSAKNPLPYTFDMTSELRTPRNLTLTLLLMPTFDELS